MQKSTLNRLIGPLPTDRRLATVVRVIRPGRYECADRQGRIFPADGDDHLPGDRVIVSAGRITGRIGIVNQYEV